MSENVGSIVYEVDANTSGLVAASKQVEAANKSMQKGFAQTDKSVSTAQKGMDKAGGSTKKLTKGMTDSEIASKKFAHSMRQSSMQLSQVAQQGSVTGNYLQALLIQLPDLALGMGTVGIVAGALAGTVGIGLLNAFTGADKATETLDETIKRLSGSFSTVAGESNEFALELKNLAKISKDALRLRLIFEQEDALKAVTEARNEIIRLGVDARDHLTALDKLAGITAFDKTAEALGITADEAERLSKAIPTIAEKANPEAYGKLAGVVAELSDKYGKGNKDLNEYARSISTVTQGAIGAASSLKRLNEVNADLDGAITNTNAPEPKSEGNAEGDRLAALFATRQAANAAAIEQIKTQFQDEQTLAEEQLEMRLAAIDTAQISIAEKDQLEIEAKALHAQKLSELDAKRTTDEQAEAAKRLSLKKMELAAYTQLGGQLNALVSAAGAENTAIGKAVFLANQALAVAGIIVNTQAAAAAALAIDLTGTTSGRITALGYTSAAIAGGVGIGQTFSGRQTGGPTEAGTPYRVGESGPELFTSGGRQFLIGGEKGNVTPNSQLGGGMSAPQVNVVVNNNTSSNVSVSQEQDGNNVTIQMLVADFAEGGPVSRAMSNSHSVKRKTT
tara:strand:- start:3074 stop:4933 length:1860 start_codon:yes stop_codon:yes gene_type:complete